MFKLKQKNIILFVLFGFLLLVVSVKPVSAAAENTGLARVSWVAPTLDAGSTAPLTDLAGYIVYYGTTTHALHSCPVLSYDVASPYDSYLDTGSTAAYAIIPNLTTGTTYYFTVVAYDTSHNISSCATVDGSSPVATEVPHQATYRGDLNADLSVDINDYAIMIANFGHTACGNPADADKICTGDHSIIDVFDYSYVIQDFGKHTP